MKLGMISGWGEDRFKFMKEKGLSAVEFCVNVKDDSAHALSCAQEIKANSEKYGIKVASIGRWGMTRIDENGDIIPEALQHDKNLIDLASFVNCPVFTCGCNFVDGKDYYENCRFAINYFRTLIEYARDKNVKIAVYNCTWCNFVFQEKAWTVILGELPELGLKYDPSHCYNRRADYLKEIRDWGHRIYHFHVKGVVHVAGESYDDPPAGLDDIRWGAVMTMLYTVGYNGTLSIEPHSSKWQGKLGEWGLDYTIKFMKNFIMPENYGE